MSPQTLPGFLFLQGLGRGGLFTQKHGFTPAQLTSAAMPGAPLKIPHDIQANPKDPSAQVAHFHHSRLRPPALEKDVLDSVLSVVRITQ